MNFYVVLLPIKTDLIMFTLNLLIEKNEHTQNIEVEFDYRNLLKFCLPGQIILMLSMPVYITKHLCFVIFLIYKKYIKV